MVDENEMALGVAESTDILCPTVEQVAEMYAYAFAGNDTWEVIGIDSSQSSEGVLNVEGQHYDSGTPFTFRLHIEDVQAVIEG